MAAFESSREAERRALQFEIASREAELRALRAQLHPHFLFNSLNSINALIAARPEEARRLCVRLADFLRRSLALGAREAIPLAEELDLALQLLAIEKTRFGERLCHELGVEDDARACPVPPLLLQPLVENAVTHGIAHVLEGGTIRVAASRGARRLTILVENPCDADRPRGRGAGVGIANVRARLGALHGTEARLDATEQNGLWRVELTMPALPSAER
jgi:LytS/YehU family sensor histidine kinase